jgi:hypothetical protein
MRIAVLIIGLMLTVGLFIQASVIFGLSDAVDDEKSAQAGAIGVLMALLWLVSCGVVIPLPRVSMVLFGIAGILGFAAAGDYPDLAIWGGISFFLAALSYFGHRGKRAAKRKEDERDEIMRSMLTHQANMAAIVGMHAPQFVDARSQIEPPTPSPLPLSMSFSTSSCPSCAAPVAPMSRFCGECGVPLRGGSAS